LLYWPEFEFNFRLDAQRLLPHIAAIEACREAAATRIVPPPWRELPESGDSSVNPLPDQPPILEKIALRKQQLMARNSSRAWTWIKQRFSPGSAPISFADIQTMHRMVAEESGIRTNTEGALRTRGVIVGRREAEGVHVGAPSERLPRLMDQYVQFITSDDLAALPAAIHSLVAHFFLTAIHPFDDGNGRVCRLISAGIMFQRGYSGHGFHAIQNHFYQNNVRYHTLLQRCFNRPLPFDLTQFVAFGLEGLATELQGISSFVKVKLNRAVKMDAALIERHKRRNRRGVRWSSPR
jgi:Fic family protein